MDCLFHDYEKTGSFRIPAYGVFYTNMPAEPNGTVEYECLKCKNCGYTFSREVPYSFRGN